MADDPWPTDLRYSKDDKTLTVSFDDGVTHVLPAEYMRVYSPSAEVRGHGADERQIVPARRHVGIIKIEPVGNYAVRLHFDDLHDTGLFTWAYLRELGDKQEAWWAQYLADLDARGLSRGT
ncbi:MAG: hypothetical protein CL566_04375 [Alphaproteobacteria bacterium]|nr:hypothetical protein [Alphaproteobacteria bacterium]|tara:strand:+ start:1143 stop:1505 length:363 start_codon:yes stop_codon:yes gene_type:complete